MAGAGSEVALTAASEGGKVALNFSLFQSGVFVKTLAGVLISAVVTVSAFFTIGVAVFRTQQDPPIANPDSYTTYKNEPILFYPLQNDIDEREGSEYLKISTIGEPFNGIAIKNLNDSVMYFPNPMWIGVDFFTYTISNSKLSAISNITITVLNHAPQPYNDFADVLKNKKLSIYVLKNDIDQDKDPLEVASVTAPSNGQASVSFDRKYVIYEPNQGYVGYDTFNYSVTDGNDTVSAQVEVNVTNTPPVAIMDEYDIGINTETDLFVLDNDYDPNDDPIHIAGTLYDDQLTGRLKKYLHKFTYTPKYQDTKTQVFEYFINDGFVNSVPTRVLINVRNTPPFAAHYVQTVKKNSKDNKVDLVYGDTNPFTELDVQITKNATRGNLQMKKTTTPRVAEYNNETVSWNENTYELFYTPEYNKLYVEKIEYTVSDGTNTTEGSIEIHVVNYPPEARDDFVRVQRNILELINVTENDDDPNFDELELISVTQGGSNRKGDANVYDRKKTLASYLPHWGKLGEDSFRYTIRDIQEDPSQALTAEATVHILIENTGPEARDDIFYVSKNLDTYLDPRLNDYDLNNDVLEILDIFNVTDIPGRTVRVESNRMKIFYSPAKDQKYTEKFQYTVWDNEKTTVNDTAQITVIVRNDPPVAVDDIFEAKWRQSDTSPQDNNIFDLVKNDYDVNPGDKEKLDIVEIDPMTHDNFIVQKIDKVHVKFIPTKGFQGTITFKYKISDGEDICTKYATVTVNVVNHPPEGVADTYDAHWTSYQNGKVLDVTKNDTDLDSDSIYVASVEPIENVGSVSVVEPAQKDVLFKPIKQKLGIAKFQYTTTDKNKIGSVAIVTVNVYNHPPVAKDDTSPPTHWRTPILVDVIQNDTDVDIEDSGNLVVSAITQYPVDGTAQISGKSIRYTPPGLGYTYSGAPQNLKYSSTQTIKYTATDGIQVSNAATLTVTFFNHRPTANPDSFNVAKNSPNFTTLNVLANDNDNDAVDMSFLTIVSASITSHTGGGGDRGTLRVRSDKTALEYQPGRGYAGTITFTYTITDGQLSHSATGTIEIKNTPPTCAEIPWNVYKATTTTRNVLAEPAYISDPNGDTLVLTVVTAASKGTASVSNNQLRFVPFAKRSGSDSFKYRVCDEQDCCENYVKLDIVNRAPFVPSCNYVFPKVPGDSQPIRTLFVLSNAYDLDNDVITITSIHSFSMSQTVTGSVSINTDNKSILYQPLKTFSSTFTFKFDTEDDDQDNKIKVTTTCTVKVSGSPPVAVADSYSIKQGTASNLYVLSNDYDPDGDAITISSVVNPQVYAPIKYDTYVRYSPDPMSCKPDGFDYQIKSDDGYSNWTHVSIKITDCLCWAKIDLCYVIDSSGSIGSSNFNSYVRPFIVAANAKFNIQSSYPEGVRGSIVQFHSSATIESELTNNRAALDSKANTMTYYAGMTATVYGLQKADEVLGRGRGTATKILFVVTDGNYNTGGDPKPTARSINARTNWTIVALGVGSISVSELQGLAGRLSDGTLAYWHVSSYSQASGPLQRMVDEACALG